MSRFLAAPSGRLHKFVSITRRVLPAALLLSWAAGCTMPYALPEDARVQAMGSAALDTPPPVLAARPSARHGVAKTVDSLPETAVLTDYVEHALRHSPALAAAYQDWRAAAERVPQARSLPDPQLGVGLVFDQVERDASYMGERYSISQRFPWFGKLGLQGDIALEDVRLAARRYEAQRLQLAEQVTGAWFELAWLHAAAGVATENRALLLSLESMTRARYRVGEASLADVNRAQVELGRIDDQLRSLEDLRGPAAARLNALLGRPADAPLQGDFGAPSTQPVPELPGLDDAQWLALARTYNPGLAAAEHAVARENRAEALARREYYPDVTLGLEYGRDASARMARMDGGGADTLAGMISFSLPIRRGRIEAGVREARARATAAARRAQAETFDLEAELRQALFVERDTARRMQLYGSTLLPKARQSLASVEAAYLTGEAGFSDLIEAHRVVLEFSLAHERAAADRALAIAGIRSLVGASFEDLDALAAPQTESVDE
ncbi:TolC family protein [Wenzhouxiangella sp. XN24]|uniref:TolC family protein n=1 Tax=Wenzhouxiangella sp. XN24 TaxID=2713569 RepID=UPI0013ECA930|nr:TolC family protein [Wenzhouxiangella sp. XN24]NGX15735.1 TolC family protein [Wenzhouxiangella sp. XN24]